MNPSTSARERVLITGGANGIGKAAAQACAARGWDVVVIDREASQLGLSLQADLANADETARALQEALAAGPITRLLNNVGVVVPALAEEQTMAQFDLAVQLNLRCAFQCMQAVLPGMKAAGFGRIVNMSSRAALGKELRSAYSMTKAGLLGLTRVWALELGQYGVTANAIGPGPIRTELFEQANPAGSPRTQAIIDGVPVKRLGEPEDVAHAVNFFLDANSGFITGQVLYVCGGMTVGVASV